jgi:hypothetical protein
MLQAVDEPLNFSEKTTDMAWDWLKHAFAVEPEGELELTDAQRRAADRVCREVVARGLATPALMFLEMSRPLNYLGAQALHFFQPFLSVFTDAEGPREFAAFLEQRASIDYLCRGIERGRARREADEGESGGEGEGGTG